VSSTPHARAVSALAIGCSAGGVDALCQLLPALDAECGIAVFVVVHLPRERPSRLVEVFSTKCQLAVLEAEDKQPVEAGAVYFAPPDYHLLLDSGPRLSLSVDQLVHFSRPAVDVLFQSAADVYGPQLIAMVLSGANEDGAAGLAAVKRAGGATLIQEPSTALATAMPEAALRAVPESPALDLTELAVSLRAIRGGLCPVAALLPRISA
jgi:two-component system, chemotaxis family, protein-glutamate methylesterase/glutaminase